MDLFFWDNLKIYSEKNTDIYTKVIGKGQFIYGSGKWTVWYDNGKIK